MVGFQRMQLFGHFKPFVPHKINHRRKTNTTITKQLIADNISAHNDRNWFGVRDLCLALTLAKQMNKQFSNAQVARQISH